jgi:peptidoglycan/xylan/chitin deacetylase (PgdA/CDA1 family)
MTKFSARRRSWRWPQNQKIAVSIGLAFEAVELQSQYKVRDTPGKPNQLSLSYAEYGANVGGWRLLDLLDSYGLKCHISTNGLAAERHPEFLSTAVEEGHEIVGHGWVNDRTFTSEDIDAERADISKTTEAIVAATGKQPLGWASPGASPTANTLRLLSEQNYAWCGDDASDDVPFVRQVPGGRSIVVLPQTNAQHNDVQIYLAPRNAPSIIWEGFRDSFDQLYSEGKDGNPGWTEILIHCHIGGRPILIPTLKRCFDHIKRHEGVWCATRSEIARWSAALADDDGIKPSD